MMYRAAKFVSAISTGVVVSVPVATIPLVAVEAADDCLTRPKDVTPAGQHWYYLIDRGSKRRCWYLHQETGTSAHASMTRRARRAAIVAARKSEPAMTRASADAYAEFGLPPGRDDDVPPVSQQTLVASDYPKPAEPDQPDTVSDAAPQSPVAARWPEPAGLRSAVVEPPPPSFVVASAAPDAGTADSTPIAPPAALETPAAAPPASLEPLFLATIGAIALTGFAGSSVYLLARVRRRPRSHTGLPHGAGRPAESVDHPRLPRWLEPTAAGSLRYPDRRHDAEL